MNKGGEMRCFSIITCFWLVLSTCEGLSSHRVASHNLPAKNDFPSRSNRPTTNFDTNSFSLGLSHHDSATDTTIPDISTIPTTAMPPKKRKLEEKNKSIVFNVWEYARVVGPQAPIAVRPRIQVQKGDVSPCVSAIISCCTARDRIRREKCFEVLGCTGHWLQIDPCGAEMMNLVLSSIRK